MSSLLSGRRAIITGAASGFGRAMAHIFAQAGADVVGTDLNQDGLAETQALLADDGLPFEALEHDVTSPASWNTVIETAFQNGPCDILVNNAGVAKLQRFGEMSLETFQSVCNVNILGPFAGTKLFVEQVRAAAGEAPARASIVNITSIAAKKSLPVFTAYGPSKAGLANLTKALAVELGLKGDFIRVNAVAPGPVRTPMTEAAADLPWEERDHSLVKAIPIARYGEIEEVAKAALYLASDRAKFVTGHTIPVDGGWGDI